MNLKVLLCIIMAVFFGGIWGLGGGISAGFLTKDPAFPVLVVFAVLGMLGGVLFICAAIFESRNGGSGSEPPDEPEDPRDGGPPWWPEFERAYRRHYKQEKVHA